MYMFGSLAFHSVPEMTSLEWYTDSRVALERTAVLPSMRRRMTRLSAESCSPDGSGCWKLVHWWEMKSTSTDYRHLAGLDEILMRLPVVQLEKVGHLDDVHRVAMVYALLTEEFDSPQRAAHHGCEGGNCTPK